VLGCIFILTPTKAAFCASVTMNTCEDPSHLWFFRCSIDPALSNLQRLQDTCQCKPGTKESGSHKVQSFFVSNAQENAVGCRWRHRTERSNRQRQSFHASVKTMTCPVVGPLDPNVIFPAFNRLLLKIAALGGARKLPSFELEATHEPTTDD